MDQRSSLGDWSAKKLCVGASGGGHHGTMERLNKKADLWSDFGGENVSKGNKAEHYKYRRGKFKKINTRKKKKTGERFW